MHLNIMLINYKEIYAFMAKIIAVYASSFNAQFFINKALRFKFIKFNI